VFAGGTDYEGKDDKGDNRNRRRRGWRPEGHGETNKAIQEEGEDEEGELAEGSRKRKMRGSSDERNNDRDEGGPSGERDDERGC
jgi:hypothetical protein